MSNSFAEAASEIATMFPNTTAQKSKTHAVANSTQSLTWAYACAQAIANSISGAPYRFYQGTDNSETDLPPDHQLYALLEPPRPYEIPSFRELIKRIFLHLAADGEVFLEVDDPRLAKKEAPNLYIHRAGNCEPVFSKSKRPVIVGWKVQYSGPDGKSVEDTVPAERMLQFNYYNISNPLRGLSPGSAGKLTLEQDANMALWNAGFFEGGGLRNPIAIFTKQVFPSEGKRKEFLKSLLRNFAGFVRGHFPLIVEGGADVRPLFSSIKDLDFVQGKKLTREEVCGLFGVPPAIVGILDSSNYGNSREQSRIYWKHTLTPKMVGFRDVLQVGLLNKFFPGVIFDWDWDKIQDLKEDVEKLSLAQSQKANAVRAYFDMGYTDEEIAVILNDPNLIRTQSEVPEKEPTGKEEVTTEEGKALIRVPTSSVTVTRGVASNVVEYDDIFTSKYVDNVNEYILEPHASSWDRFIKTFEKIYATEEDPQIREALWKRAARAVVKSIYTSAARRAVLELEDPEAILSSFSGQKPKSLVIPVEIDEPVMTLVNFLYTAYSEVSGDPKWYVEKIYHSARFSTHAALGVTSHEWVCNDCQVAGHQDLNGTKVTLWRSFPDSEGSRYPLSEEFVPGPATCSCTTLPSEIGK